MDFYERMTPRNKRLTQLHVFSMVASAGGFALLLWSLALIKTEHLFSDDAKKHLLAPYGWAGYGLVVACVRKLKVINNATHEKLTGQSSL